MELKQMDDKQMKTTVEKMVEEQAERMAEKKAMEEELKALKQHANHCFGSPAGKKVARFMMKMSGIYNVNKNATDPALMGEHRGMAKVYLVLVKGLLDSDLIAEIERPIKKED
jgi:hypothetical protein